MEKKMSTLYELTENLVDPRLEYISTEDFDDIKEHRDLIKILGSRYEAKNKSKIVRVGVSFVPKDMLINEAIRLYSNKKYHETPGKYELINLISANKRDYRRRFIGIDKRDILDPMRYILLKEYDKNLSDKSDIATLNFWQTLDRDASPPHFHTFNGCTIITEFRDPFTPLIVAEKEKSKDKNEVNDINIYKERLKQIEQCNKDLTFNIALIGKSAFTNSNGFKDFMYDLLKTKIEKCETANFKWSSKQNPVTYLIYHFMHPKIDAKKTSEKGYIPNMIRNIIREIKADQLNAMPYSNSKKLEKQYLNGYNEGKSNMYIRKKIKEAFKEDLVSYIINEIIKQGYKFKTLINTPHTRISFDTGDKKEISLTIVDHAPFLRKEQDFLGYLDREQNYDGIVERLKEKGRYSLFQKTVAIGPKGPLEDLLKEWIILPNLAGASLVY